MAGPETGRPALERQRYRLGQGRLQQLLRPVAVRDHVVHPSHERFQPATDPGTPGKVPDHHFLRRADHLSHAGAGGSRNVTTVQDATALHRRRRTAQPRDYRYLEKSDRPDDPGRLRADRNRDPLRQFPLYRTQGPAPWGKPAPGIDLQVIDDAGNIAGPDSEGDIAVRIRPQPPQGFFREYRNDPERTAATRRGDWYVTGDRACRDEDGYFWFVSRGRRRNPVGGLPHRPFSRWKAP